MIAVVDTCYFLRRGPFNPDIKKILLPKSVKKELLNEQSREHYNLYKYMMEIREPAELYIKHIESLNDKMHFGLSRPDIEIVALTVELHEIFCNTWVDSTNINDLEEVVCLTLDNGIKQCLRHLNLYDDKKFLSKIYKMRCFACYAMYDDKLDFCRKCGMNTITRVSVIIDENNKEKVLLKRNFKFRPKTLYDNRGVELRSSGQREYEHFTRTKGYKTKKNALTDVLGDLQD